MKSKETKYLKGIFGENWREGARRDKTVDRVTESDLNRTRERRSMESEQKTRSIMKDSIIEMNKRGAISGQKRDRLINIAEQI